MRFATSTIEEIRKRTDLVALIGRRVKLVRKGRVMWGCCPFHNEKSSSFKVENERQAFKCFGCGAGGDAFRWLMEIEGLSFVEAVRQLADVAGVALPKATAEDGAREVQRKSLYDIVERACAWFEAQLYAKDNSGAREYLRSRGLTGEIAKRFRVGYAPASGLVDHLTDHNVGLDDMIAAGVARRDDRGVRDFFFDRIMFPIADARGRVIGFGGRVMGSAMPKYVNTGDTPLFSKGELLYHFSAARPAGIKAQSIIVSEGYLDVIALAEAGFTHSVAPLGTALTEVQLKLLWSVAAEPVITLDGDAAGLRAAHRAARLALPLLKPGYSLRFAFLPAGEDPDSFLRANTPEAMTKLLAGAEPLSAALWRFETEGKDFVTPERRAGLERALGELVAGIGDAQVQDYYRRDFERRVSEAFKKRESPQRRHEGHTGRSAVSPALRASPMASRGRAAVLAAKEAVVARLLLEDPALAHRHTELLAEVTFSHPRLEAVRAAALDMAADQLELGPVAFRDHLLDLGMADTLERLGLQPPEPDADARLSKAIDELRMRAERP